MLFVFRVTAGQEKIVAEMVAKKVRKEKLGVQSVIVFDSFNGYIIVEASDALEARKASAQVNHVKGVLSRPLPMEEIKSKFGEYVPKVVSLSAGDTVEMISGSFKGDRAKIIRVDMAKDLVTIELMDIAVPIPITLKSEMVKLLEKAESSSDE